jgi:NAD(P)-dependent dehydrogenase (short-subunit alcohol dehydrogenase family)
VKLNKKIIIITGGSGLLGRNIIEELQAEGAFCINAEINEETSENLSTIQCDITDEKSVEKTINSVLKVYGKIDGLVNNAYPRTKDWGLHFEDIPVESWKENIDMQMNSVFMFCQKILPIMAKQSFGSVVNITSIYGIVGPDFGVYEGTKMTMPAAYSAIKGGVINFSRYLASYYGKFGIRVNCVSPGGIFDNQPVQFVTNYEAKVPMKRMGLPKDISPTISFLLSEGSSYITGQNIVVDGGWTAI